jgi:hypothetical protein
MFQLLAVSHSEGSWTRNLLPDGWKEGSGGNSQYWGPGTAGDVSKSSSWPGVLFIFVCENSICPNCTQTYAFSECMVRIFSFMPSEYFFIKEDL